jgi:hypothetical protein
LWTFFHSSRRSGELQSFDAGAPGAQLVFARLGDYWHIAYRDKAFALKDAKGLGYIQRLVQNPGQEFHSIDLLGGMGAATEIDAHPI